MCVCVCVCVLIGGCVTEVHVTEVRDWEVRVVTVVRGACDRGERCM